MTIYKSQDKKPRCCWNKKCKITKLIKSIGSKRINRSKKKNYWKEMNTKKDVKI